ncbi:TIGR02569 family protein [Arthrobacter sp. NEB 688]|uniref:TIGR02569 family protein n=1 Tax=Arthrobacter sp. NEB 688 TaxID=904039 RepID=UPI0015656E11|nr:TIGR02569 family protein [Arthrobacter sp. NEB 688]QKE84652.1 TIGR02569 family protein [Arthrobacter sp. NEB 688]
MTAEHVPASVLEAFGADDPPRLLTGGQGTSWRSGGLVLKPGSGPIHAWLGEGLEGVSAAEFRLATPVRTIHGTWSWDGWSATQWVEGTEPDQTKESTWLKIIEAGRAFHQAVAHLRRPDCLHARNDWWAIADRVAWGEHNIRFRPEFAALGRRLHGAVEPLGASQIVHGDLTGNVMFSPTLPPAVIDISPYWRPPEYAEGVVVADALCWHSAQASLLDEAGVSVAAVARALLFRMATTSQAASAGRARGDVEADLRRYDHAAAAIGL